MNKETTNHLKLKSKPVKHTEMFADKAYAHKQLDRLLDALEAFKEGNIDVRLTKERNDKFAQLAEAYNTMADRIGGVNTEVSRITRVVGIEGSLDSRAEFKAAKGIWMELIFNINIITEAISKPVLEVSRILNCIGKGELEEKFNLTVAGDFLAMSDLINDTLDRLNLFADQVTQVAKQVGVEGILGGQAHVPDATGTWKDLTDNVNQMATNLTSQVREIAEVTTSVANGDLSRKITEEEKGGEVLELSTTINGMVDSLKIFASEVNKVSKEVGVQGILGGQAEVPNVAGIWKNLTDNVNTMASNLTAQVRDISSVAKAVANGDLSHKVTINVKGEIAELKTVINQMVDSLNIFAFEVTKVLQVVGSEGKLGVHAVVPNVAGMWKDLTDNVNRMSENISDQWRAVGNVAVALSHGDLTQKVTLAVEGEIRTYADAINQMVDDLNVFAGEVSRVAKEVGTDGILGGEALVPNVAGIWKDVTENVNVMAKNLTAQVREIAKVATAVANGDLTQQIQFESKGEIAELVETLNQMVDSLNVFSDEVSRVAKEVGTEGKLGGQAKVPNVAGTWKNLTDSVNNMAANLTEQVREIATVAKAVAEGDLTQKINIKAKGEIAELTRTINKMVDSLNTFSDEVTRVAREVGTEGILGEKAKVPNVAGAWLELTDNVNTMGANLTNQVREISKVTTAVANGDLTQKISEKAKGGEVLELSRTINTMVDSLTVFSNEVSRVAKEVGTDGVLGGQAEVPNLGGAWRDLTNNVNTMATNLTDQVRAIAEVATAVANGDLSKKIAILAKGEILDLKNTINQMVASLTVFASEVTRVAKEVGTDGKLGGEAKVPNVAGTWKGLTDNVNHMASNLTNQVREIATITKAVAYGDLSQKIAVKGKGGEVLELSKTINKMVDVLNNLADEVTNVAREVGTEGILGGQADVPHVAGSWKNLTENVNLMASNLTSQVRDIAGVSTALTLGDFSRKINVEVEGEVLELKNNINAMVDSFKTIVQAANTIAKGDFSLEMPMRSEADELGIALNTMTDNLHRISIENENETWIKTGQARLNDKMRGELDLSALTKNIISFTTKYIGAQVGVLYLAETKDNETIYRLTSSYALAGRTGNNLEYKNSDSLVGQSAREKKTKITSQIPKDSINISSGLAVFPPKNILVQPFILEDKVTGVLEFGSLNSFADTQIELLEIVSLNIATAINSSIDRKKMKKLLAESQRKSDELVKRQQEMKVLSNELQTANTVLEVKTEGLEKQKDEIQENRLVVEQKANKLELDSQYKSNFLAYMSLELKTPLNALLLSAKALSEDKSENLNKEQVKDASIIYERGTALLTLIDEILDLSKIEARKLQILPSNLKIKTVLTDLKNKFTPLAEKKGLQLVITKNKNVPNTIFTDGQRLEQILTHLLSNAFKFTISGKVEIQVHKMTDHSVLLNSHLKIDSTIGIEVTDSGIGISQEKQALIIEAFQQVYGSSKKRENFGLGLGLTISREFARLLGGEIHLKSIEGEGSSFTLYVPIKYNSLD